ncbi:hypothetical protein [Sphingomonas bacterium]|uniref:hypothetical protein n=1 Tax=Sphingomonas bacterium TaxID=1895847 RepID=UPI001576BD91|nr:hypothetical protein [Sphingomonas bacterium]
MKLGICGLAGLLAATLFASPTISATPTDFDCDVPADHFSSVSQAVVSPISIKGVIDLVQLRSGNNLPVAGVRLVSTDGANSAGFRLVASSAGAKKLDVRLNTKRGDVMKEDVAGQVDAKATVPFALSLSSSGQVTLTVSGSSFVADFVPIGSGKAMAFCSTAQFKFTNLIFGSESSTAVAGQ